MTSPDHPFLLAFCLAPWGVAAAIILITILIERRRS